MSKYYSFATVYNYGNARMQHYFVVFFIWWKTVVCTILKIHWDPVKKHVCVSLSVCAFTFSSIHRIIKLCSINRTPLRWVISDVIISEKDGKGRFRNHLHLKDHWYHTVCHIPSDTLLKPVLPTEIGSHTLHYLDVGWLSSHTIHELPFTSIIRYCNNSAAGFSFSARRLLRKSFCSSSTLFTLHKHFSVLPMMFPLEKVQASPTWSPWKSVTTWKQIPSMLQWSKLELWQSA
jgi:hypothetical protein